VGANVRGWYDEMPKVQRVRRVEASNVNDTRDAAAMKTLESYMKSSVCVICRERVESDTPLCQSCLAQSNVSLLALSRQLAAAETKAANLEKVCRSCASLAWREPVKCDSKDCPVFYTRTRHMSLLRSTRAAVRPASRLLESVGAKLYDW
jgi:DNA polymerase zeta